MLSMSLNNIQEILAVGRILGDTNAGSTCQAFKSYNLKST